jgi:hypothetical protein
MLAYLDTLIGFAVIMLGSSLLIMIATQIISALLSHRGSNLRWGLVTLFQNVPNSPLMNNAENAEKLATDVLTHPLISDSIFSRKLPIPIPRWLADRFKLATAIHPDELVAILKDLATRPAYQAIAGLPAEIDALVAAQNPAADRRIALITGSLALTALPLTNAVPLLQGTVDSIKDETGKLEAWFNATMDRVSQRFTTYMRLWTIGFAITFAALTGLNSVTLLSKLYSNGDFRQQVTGTGTQMLDLAGRVMPEGPEDVAKKMYTDLVVKALQAAGANTDTAPSGIDSEAAGEAWIMAHVTEGAQQAAAIHELNTAVLDQRTQDATTIRTILTKSSFDVLQFRWQKGQPVWPQLPGVFATAALLSLGAPFWFNMLKQLTNLRPILSNRTDTPASK